jgi:hypothetical protein
LTRFSVGDAWADLETADNSGSTVSLQASPDAYGEIVLTIRISPDSISQFGYINALSVTKLD